MKRAFFICVILLGIQAAGAQEYTSGSKRAVRHFEEAVEFYRNMDTERAEEELLAALKADDRFLEAYQLLAQLYLDTGRLDEAVESYARTLEIDPEGHPESYRLLASMVLRTGDYQRARGLLDRYLAFPAEQTGQRAAGEAMRDQCLYALEAMKHPVPFQPENLGDSVNSPYNEYWPSVSLDEQLLMFTVMLPVEGELHPSGPSVQEDFFYSLRTGGGWSMRKNAGPPLNTPDNEGAQAMTADGNLLYFTACNRKDGKGNCDIYVAVKSGGKWTRPLNLGSPVNSRFSEKHPTISADGRVLMFASDRPGGKGSYDIWMSTRAGDGWSSPVNLGDSVNTSGVEQSPFLHPDQRSLYFSSTGWRGMGQGDLFLSRRDTTGAWTRPVNLGYPINTYNDEIGLTVGPDGTEAFFASDRGEGTDTDIFTFRLPEELRPEPVSYMAGRVYDAGNMKGLVAVIQLIDLETEEVVTEVPSREGEGDYLASLPGNRDYALNVTAGGYLFYSAHFPFRGIHSRMEPLRMDIPMERITPGKRVVMNNIFFETDSYGLKKESLAELERVVAFLRQNSDIVVEISGHTDNTGTPAHNQELSEKRAEVVLHFLAEHGIQEDRMRAVGYGDKVPVSSNDTEKGRAMNRRTELKILEIRP
jgi:outer membrane protein OmpA-like peptidoglycan-associated protein